MAAAAAIGAKTVDSFANTSFVQPSPMPLVEISRLTRDGLLI